MKRLVSFLLALFCLFGATAQRTPEELKAIIDTEFSGIYDKYEAVVAFDSVLQLTNRYLQEAEQWTREYPSAKNIGNAAIWHSFRAYLLDDFQEKRISYGRSEIENPDTSDPKTWDKNTFRKMIHAEFLLSLKEETALQQIPAESYTVLFQMPDETDCYATLYDLLAYRYADYLEKDMNLPSDFSIDREEFYNYYFRIPENSPNPINPFVQLMDQIEQFHRSDSDLSYSIYGKLIRYGYIYRNCTLANNDSLYLAALLRLNEEAGNVSRVVRQLVYHKIAVFYHTRGNESATYPDDLLTAIDWYKKAIDAAPRTRCGERCADNLASITKKNFTLILPHVPLYPEEQPMQILTKDCDTIYLAVAECPDRQFKRGEPVTLDIVYRASLPIRNSHQYRTDTTFTVFPSFPCGNYLLLLDTIPIHSTVSFQQYFNAEDFNVTRLEAMYVTNDNDVQIIVVDRKKGNPLPQVQATLTAWGDSSNRHFTRKTDRDGIVHFSAEELKDSYMEVTLKLGNDVLETGNGIYFNHTHWQEQARPKARLYTDRAIYRPGQTMEWKAILLDEKDEIDQIVPYAPVTIELKDDNDVLIQRDTMRTNAFGAAAGQIKLPSNGFLGLYTLRFYYNNKFVESHYINVEEYKRPTFEASIDQPDGTYKVGSAVTVSGTATAYAGYAVQGAKVEYRIVRKASFPFRYHGWWLRPRPDNQEKEIANGECITDEEGRFTIRFTAIGDPKLDPSTPLYRYAIKATVSDISGETHDVSATVPVSERSLLFQVDLPECIQTFLGQPSIGVRTTNLAGEPQSSDVRYEVVRLKQPDRYRIAAPFVCNHTETQFDNLFPQYDFHQQQQPHLWPETVVVANGKITTSEQSVLSIPKLSSLKSGSYKLKLSTTDAFGEMVEEEFCFYIAQTDKDFPYYSPLQIETENETVTTGDTLTFVIGSHLENQPVLIRIQNNGNVLEQKWIKIDKGTYRYSRVIRDGEKGTYTCEAYTQWNNHSFHRKCRTKIVDRRRDIHFEFVTFRDKTEPGKRETVKIRLKDGTGTPLSNAELLCTLYDASLDVFKTNSFDKNLFTDKETAANFLKYLFGKYFCYGDFTKRGITSHSMTLPTWATQAKARYYFGTWFHDAEVPLFRSNARKAAPGRTVTGVLGARSDGAQTMISGMVLNEITENNDDAPPLRFMETGETGDGNETGDENEDPVIPLRSNFNETAFFYPFLTVKDGVAEFEYTVPESLTKWKMLGAAHTTQRQYGTFEKFVVTQKPLMVSPNLLRFVYAGDQWEFAAKIINTSGERLDGEVDIQFRDAKDGSVILADKREIRLDSGATELIQEFVLIPEGFVGVTYVVTVEASGGGNTYSDGETGDIPVLSRKQIVTEALPLFITKKGSRTFSLQNLPAANNNIISCKLQFTPDARWNAILALPYLMEYPYDCNEQLFSKLYANTVAAHIVGQNPNFQSLLKNAMDQNPESLRSKLVQNSDLKQILLTETPWVTDAMDEDNEIQNINCLFDTENLAEQRKAMVHKLERNQNADGGWNWFSSRYNEKSSRYITQHLLIGSGRLMAKGICKAGYNFLSESTLDKAIRFIDEDVEKEYTKMKKENPEWLDIGIVASSELHYLYARSFFLKKKPAKTEAYRFYKNKLVHNATQLDGIYLKTMAALTLWQCNESGDREVAKQLMNDIKKRAIHSEEMGMYWKKEGYGWHWYEAPIERQALLIEAFQTILQDEESVKEMKIWLLQQKRTQHWNSTRSTADACYALLLDNDLTQSDPTKHITVSLCWETIDLVDTMQMPMKQDVTACVEKGSNGTVTLTRDTDGLSYGGVFVRYYKDIDEVEGTGRDMPMSVERQLYKVTTGERGEVLTELGADGALQVGDRVRVRMVLRADRDLEFVHLKDLRAAAFEPTETLSGYRWQDGLSYYQSFRDASVNFFFDWLRKGTYVFEYTLFVTQSGTYSSGYASIQCMYAPEFCAHSASSGRITIRNSK